MWRRRVRGSLIVGGVLLLAGLWASPALGTVPTSLTHQGRLLDEEGEPKTGEVKLKFTIYEAKTGGALVWESKTKTVDLGDAGFYSVTLGGQQNPINAETLQGQTPLWIGLKVDGGEELSPRIRLRSVPYAVRAGTAARAEKVPWKSVEGKPDGVEETIGGLSCSSGQVPAWDGGTWNCQKITDQNTVYSKSCNEGEVVGGLQSDGTVVCVSDDDTTYSAGAGIDESGNTFSLSGQSCSSGDVVTGVQNGVFQCTNTVGQLNAGQGLSVDKTTGNVTVSADYSQVQQRISNGCPDGEVMVGVNQDGSPDCEMAGESGTPSQVDGNCQSGAKFIPAKVCPIGDNDGPDCDTVGVGALCEDTGCSGLDSSLDNCGIWDWYLRTE